MKLNIKKKIKSGYVAIKVKVFDRQIQCCKCHWKRLDLNKMAALLKFDSFEL